MSKFGKVKPRNRGGSRPLVHYKDRSKVFRQRTTEKQKTVRYMGEIFLLEELEQVMYPKRAVVTNGEVIGWTT